MYGRNCNVYAEGVVFHGRQDFHSLFFGNHVEYICHCFSRIEVLHSASLQQNPWILWPLNILCIHTYILTILDIKYCTFCMHTCVRMYIYVHVLYVRM